MAIFERLKKLYNGKDAEVCYLKIQTLIEEYKNQINSKKYNLSQKDIILITYADMLSGDELSKIATLQNFLDSKIEGYINSVHFLPFFPWTSDDGFSIVDYRAIDSDLGSWRDIKLFAKKYRLMFDAVINHCSKSSDMFQQFLNNEQEFKNYFIEVDPDADTSKVVRPRALPLLTQFEDSNGLTRHIWTTFSDDQVDLNFSNYKVLLDILDILLLYIEKGARLLRLDAVAFLWKILGTSCLHLEQTHEIVKLIKEVINEVAPEVILVTETNVPHQENISYFGNGYDEAGMVYNFTLPPLLAFSILTKNTEVFTQWAQGLKLPSDQTCFFNFTASHDGIGVRPLQGILNNDEIEFLATVAKKHGGKVSYKDNGDGTKSPYELNCNYCDFLTDLDSDDDIRAKRMVLSQAVTLVMPGVPGIYFHSLFGSRNFNNGVKETGRNRTINREKLNVDDLNAQLNTGLRKKIFTAYKKLLGIRINEEAFNPYTPAEFLNVDKSVIAIARHSEQSSVLCLFNVSDTQIEVIVPSAFNLPLIDLITGKKYELSPIIMEPLEILWLKSVK